MAETYRIPIEGMTCSSCVAHITKAVRKVPGVERVRVDLATESATITLDPGRTSIREIGAAISMAGYEPGIDDAVPEPDVARPGILARLGLVR